MDQTINVALEAKVSNILIISSDKTIESKLTKDKVTFVYQENEDLNKAIKCIEMMKEFYYNEKS